MTPLLLLKNLGKPTRRLSRRSWALASIAALGVAAAILSPGKAQADTSPPIVQWSYSAVQNLGTATYPGNVNVLGNLSVAGQYLPPAATLPTPNPQNFANLVVGGDWQPAVQACINFAAANFLPAYIVGGPGAEGAYPCASDLLLPVGPSQAQTINLIGAGWNQGGLIFNSAAATHGLYSNGNSSTFPYASSVENLRIVCTGGAGQGITDFGLNSPRRRMVQVVGAAGVGISVVSCNVPAFDQCYVIGCGSIGGVGEVEFDRCTVVWWNGRIEGGAVGCQTGLKIDRTSLGRFYGVSESNGFSWMVASKAESALGCSNITIEMDCEHPSDGGGGAGGLHAGAHYGEAGYGLTGSALVQNLVVAGTHFPSGAATVPYGFMLANCYGTRFRADLTLSQPSTATAAIWLETTTNNGTVVEACYINSVSGNTFPWVMINGVQATAASPRVTWDQSSPKAQGTAKTLAVNSTTPTTLVLSMGGVAERPQTANTGATSITTLAGAQGNNGLVIYLQAADANTTLVHDATQAVADGFFLTAQANLALTNKLTICLMSNNVQWRQVT